MSLFMGLHQNRLDGKGRVSIPAAFRTVLRQRAADGETPALVLRSSHKYKCIEGWAAADYEKMSAKFDTLEDFSNERDDLTLLFFGDATPIVPDKEGRLVLPEMMVRYANLTDAVYFVGTRNTFEIWEPSAHEARLAQARANAINHRLPAMLQ